MKLSFKKNALQIPAENCLEFFADNYVLQQKLLYVSLM